MTGVSVEDRTIPGPQGAPDLPVRIFTPQAGAGPHPGVLDIHGGGFAVGTPRLDDAGNLGIVREVGAVVVSVDYRLAPETPFPGPAEDCRHDGPARPRPRRSGPGDAGAHRA